MSCTLVKDKRNNWWIYDLVDGEYTFHAGFVNNVLRLRDPKKGYKYLNITQSELAGLIYFNPDYNVKVIEDEEVNILINKEINEKNTNN